MQKYSFDKETLVKIGKGILIAGGGAAAVYALEVASTLDFGQFTPIAVAICSILINVVKEYCNGV